jgi:hypothetical protein
MLDAFEVMIPPMTEPTFKTPAEAIAFGVSMDKTRRHPRLSACIGQKICSAWWRDDALFLRLENRIALHFQYADSAVDLSIEDNTTNDFTGVREPREITLTLSPGMEWRWGRSNLIQALLGNSVYRIWASQHGYFLYVTSVDILWINFLIDRATGSAFLHWSSTQ